MSRLLGPPAHQCFVCPHFDAALERFEADDFAATLDMMEAAGQASGTGIRSTFPSSRA